MRISARASIGLVAAALIGGAAQAQDTQGDWRADAPGVVHRIAPDAMPPPFADRSASNTASVTAPPAEAFPRVPAGFSVQLYATGLRTPRILRVAPNGDVFVAESGEGRIRVLRAADGAAKPEREEVFATGLDRPFGLAFWPPGPQPQFLYVANNNNVQRFAYRNGDLVARAAAETVVPQIAPTGFHHWTRDIAFSADGRSMYVSVGSASNVAEGMPRRRPDEIAAIEARFGRGAAWGDEESRADVLVFDPDGGNRRVFATGIRNCVGLAVHPQTRDVWCSTNERDGLGDNLPPDYVTRVAPGGFYGWPWFYIGGHEDPRHAGERPDLAARVQQPDVLIQAHSAPLAMTFYTGAGPAAFPAEYQGDAFVALHGSWNRSRRTGYKVVRIHLRNGVPDATYTDFLTGFVLDDAHVWGRPVGVAVTHDGALLVSEDGRGTIWRVAPSAR
jgi:glucose/arabinose dehydrogenase